MDANVTVGSVACVNFPKEIIGKKFSGMAVIKASPEMGFLVWLGDYRGEYSRKVTVSKSVGDISISNTFATVGNFYHLVPVCEIIEHEFGESIYGDTEREVAPTHARNNRSANSRTCS